MKLLEAEPAPAPEAAPAAPPEAPPHQPSSTPQAAAACRACGAPMQADQNWCLACGSAAPGRLGGRPGWGAASTVIALTVVLALGAIAASYAALHHQGRKPPPAAAAPPPATQPQAPPPAATQTTPPATSMPQTTTPSPADNGAKLPKVHAPKTTTAQGSPVKPVSPTTTTPTTPSATSTGTTTTPKGTTTPKPTPTAPVAIDLAADAGGIYDPYGRAAASGQTARALDGDPSTSWYVDPKDAAQVGVGYVVDLGRLRGIREIQLQTPTPGFRIEIYATDEAKPPPDILDTRWSHIRDASDVGAKGGDGKRKIVLGAGTTKYRTVLLWFTKPPTDGPRLRLAELKLLG